MSGVRDVRSANTRTPSKASTMEQCSVLLGVVFVKIEGPGCEGHALEEFRGMSLAAVSDVICSNA